jgi:hypothetical protein
MASMVSRKPPSVTRLLFVVLALMIFTTTSAEAASCTVESGAHRVVLLELYTSEGCDSCPPADRWVSSLPARGLDSARVVALGFHVDYWNYLGWADPFAKSDYSARQRAASQRHHTTVVYTPQLLLNGADYRRGIIRDDFADRVNAVNQIRPDARISLELTTGPAAEVSVQGTAAVPEAARREGAQAYLALYENNLVTAVAAGENRGKQLRHDAVVRALAGPFPVDARGEAAFAHHFTLDPAWKRTDLRVASFVQNRNTGDVLQALAAPFCP